MCVKCKNAGNVLIMCLQSCYMTWFKNIKAIWTFLVNYYYYNLLLLVLWYAKGYVMHGQGAWSNDAIEEYNYCVFIRAIIISVKF